MRNNIMMKSSITCKITYFGEARSSIRQTCTFLSGKSDRVDKGTIPYMAPEILPGGNLAKLDLESLIKVDLWSIAMILFHLINPDVSYPFQVDFNTMQCVNIEMFIGKRLNVDKLLPAMSNKYDVCRWKEWALIAHLYYALALINPAERPLLSSQEIKNIMMGDDLLKHINLNVSQESILSQYSEEVARDI